MIKKLLPLYIALAIFLPMIFTPSCANTTEAPTGGDKDTIPPVIVAINPLPGATHVPVSGTKLIFTFNEYVQLKNAQGIFLSPPLEKRPVSKIKGKSIIISFEEDLKPGTTYTLDFNDAVADNNEGNMFAGFTYVFSTGSQIDSMYITGVVQDCNTLKPVKDATVMIYKDHSDSAVFKERPFAAAKTDEWGFFSLQYLQDTLYRLYAVKDDGGNNIYDPDVDLVGFVDKAVRPLNKVNDTIYELFKFDMKDTLECLNRKTEYEIRLFRERPTKQYSVNKVRTSPRSAYISFMAPNVWIDSLWVAGISPNRLITQMNIEQDSLELWINDRRKMPDTMHVFLNYRKTDSLGRLLPELEHLRLVEEGAAKKKAHSRRDVKHEDTICVYTLKATPETFDIDGFELEFNFPIINGKFNDITLKSINPKQKEAPMKFEVEHDSLNLRRYVLRPVGKIQQGWEYKMKVPHRAFRDINGYYSDSTEVKVSLPTSDELSSLEVVAEGVDRKVIVDLLEEKTSNLIRSYVIDKNKTLHFPYLKEGRYSIRITDDGNRNSIVDTGSLLDHRQPEKVLLFKIGDKDYIDIPKATDISQTINIKELLEQ